ncbi:MAG: hypothetical protein J6N71_11070 [Muribaculaceae bacterium]|nr:hypothetical protein [Muribaculaceae bacterium]
MSAEQNEKRSFFIFYASTQPDLSKISESRAQNKSLLCVFSAARFASHTPAFRAPARWKAPRGSWAPLPLPKGLIMAELKIIGAFPLLIINYFVLLRVYLAKSPILRTKK